MTPFSRSKDDLSADYNRYLRHSSFLRRSARVGVSLVVAMSLSTSALAGDLLSSASNAVQQQASESRDGRMPRGYLWPGIALFAGGMAVGLNGFLNNKNGKFPEFGEASSTDVKMGAAGLSVAFVGGALLFLGKRHARQAPSVTFNRGGMSVSSRISW
jgi:hypothetical protein